MFHARPGRVRKLKSATSLELPVLLQAEDVSRFYQVVDPDMGINLRAEPDTSSEGTAYVLIPGEAFHVSRVIQDGGQEFLCLSDGRGWAFTRSPKDGAVICVRCTEQEVHSLLLCIPAFVKFLPCAFGLYGRFLAQVMEAGGTALDQVEAMLRSKLFQTEDMPEACQILSERMFSQCLNAACTRIWPGCFPANGTEGAACKRRDARPAIWVAPTRQNAEDTLSTEGNRCWSRPRDTDTAFQSCKRPPELCLCRIHAKIACCPSLEVAAYTSSQ